MVVTLWIHRPDICDMLVYFDTLKSAYDFGFDFLMFHGDASIREYAFDTLDSTLATWIVGDSCDLQLSIHEGKFFHEGWGKFFHEGWSNGQHSGPWSPQGTVLLSPDEAMDLGNTDEPSDFVKEGDNYFLKKESGLIPFNYINFTLNRSS